MKKYPFRFSKLMIFIFVLGLILCVGGFALNLMRLLSYGAEDAYGWISYVLLFFVSVFLAVIIISMLIRSQYVINDQYLIMQFGIIRSKYELKKIASVHLFQGAKKLAVYFDDNRYMAIVVNDAWFDDFVKTLTDKNPPIGFSFSTAEEEDELKKK